MTPATLKSYSHKDLAQMAKQGGGMDTVNEMPAARRSIVPAYLLETPTGKIDRGATLQQIAAQHPALS